jgi:predicted amidohydrolase YtcJ
MRVVIVDDKIKELQRIIEQGTQELFRIQGRLQAYEDMKANGVTEIQVPEATPEATPEAEQEESTQE